MNKAEVEGILLVDKGLGSSSFQVISKIRKALRTKSVGHTGTLDPLATGLLVVLVGRYTRLSNYLMDGEKTYEAIIELGSSTTTDDKEGECLEQGEIPRLEAQEVQSMLLGFKGDQLQVPPTFSAISINGVRSYKRARAGETVEMPARKIVVHDIHLKEMCLPHLVVEITCSKGTYIRSLARDIGRRLGVPAHLAGLRRTKCSEYDVVYGLKEEELIDSEKVFAHLSTKPSTVKGIEHIQLSEGQANRLRNGQRASYASTHADPDGRFLAYLSEHPVAICRIENSELVCVRGF